MFRLVALFVPLIFIISGIGYWYYKDSQSRIEALRSNAAKLEMAVETSQRTIKAMNEQAIITQQRVETLNKNLQEAEALNSKLVKLFQKHNLTLLAENKPGLIEKRINDATKKLFDDIMLYTTAR